jgi:arylsulfatase A-like enzyme
LADFFCAWSGKTPYTTYMSGKWHLGDKEDGFPSQHGFDYVRNFLAYYAGVYCYDDVALHPFFPFDHPKFVEAYNKIVDDAEYEADPGQSRKVVKQHFKCGDLPTIDDEQAASAQAFIKQHANDAKPLFMYVAFMKVHNPN